MRPVLEESFGLSSLHHHMIKRIIHGVIQFIETSVSLKRKVLQKLEMEDVAVHLVSAI